MVFWVFYVVMSLSFLLSLSYLQSPKVTRHGLDDAPRKQPWMEEVTNELVMMQQLAAHPNIVTIKEFFREKERSSPGEPQGQSSPPQVYRRCKVDISA